MVIGVQLAAAIQQGRGAVLNALDHDRQTSLVAVHIAVIQAVHLMLHQGLVGLGAEVHHELLDHRAGLFHIAAGGLVLVAVAVPVVAVISVARISVGYQGSSQGAGVGGSGLGRIGTVAALAVAFTIAVSVVAVSVVAVSVAIPIVVAVVPIVIPCRRAARDSSTLTASGVKNCGISASPMATIRMTMRNSSMAAGIWP